MKILHVESGMNLYGGALQVDYLLSGLQQHGCENILVCPRGSQIAAAAQDKVDRLYAITMRGDLDVAFVFRLLRIIRQERPDIIHLHSRRGADLLGGIAARLARRATGCCVLLTRRVDNPEPRWWVNIKYRLYDHVVTISQGIRRVLLDEGLVADRVSCVPSAVDTQRFSQACNRQAFIHKLGLDQWLDKERLSGARFIGMVAQFIERKGHRYLLDAIPAIVERHPQAVFLLFGKGPLLATIREQVAASEYLSACVYLPGFRGDLEHCLPCLDILAHPAEMEGLGVSLLQAAACGVPLVGTNAGGIPEIVRDNETGYLIPVASPEALAAAINRLLDAPETAARLGQQAKAVVNNEFSIKAMVTGNLRVYHELLERRV